MGRLITCKVCRGTGKLPCPTCGGTGIIYEQQKPLTSLIRYPVWQPRRCTNPKCVCGKIICEHCEGKGRITVRRKKRELVR